METSIVIALCIIETTVKAQQKTKRRKSKSRALKQTGVTFKVRPCRCTIKRIESCNDFMQRFVFLQALLLQTYIL